MSKTSSIGRKTDIVLRLAYTVSSLCTEKRNRDYCGVTYMYHHDTLSHHFVFFICNRDEHVMPLEPYHLG
jgi:hypothetical protein